MYTLKDWQEGVALDQAFDAWRVRLRAPLMKSCKACGHVVVRRAYTAETLRDMKMQHLLIAWRGRDATAC